MLSCASGLFGHLDEMRETKGTRIELSQLVSPEQRLNQLVECDGRTDVLLFLLSILVLVTQDYVRVRSSVSSGVTALDFRCKSLSISSALDFSKYSLRWFIPFHLSVSEMVYCECWRAGLPQHAVTVPPAVLF